MILACTLIFLWDWLTKDRDLTARKGKLLRLLPVAIFAIAAWLLYLCDSKTSIMALGVGITILLSIKIPMLRSRIRALGIYAAVIGVGYFIADYSFGLTEMIITSMGRDMTFTGRTDVWRELFATGTDPLLGTGYMSFWDDPRYQSLLPEWVAYSAHNGYIEIYLTGGMIGLGFLGLMLLSTGLRINRALASESDYALVRLAIFVMMLIANFAESNFAWMTALNFLFILAVIGEAPTFSARQYYVPDPASDEELAASPDVPAQPDSR
jgi:exopolysaccharide production protein ExoQ